MSAIADVGDHIPTSPSRFQILENIPEAEEREEGEINQEEAQVIVDKQELETFTRNAAGEESNQRTLRPGSSAKSADSLEKHRKEKDQKEDKNIFGNGKYNKASARKN